MNNCLLTLKAYGKQSGFGIDYNGAIGKPVVMYHISRVLSIGKSVD